MGLALEPRARGIQMGIDIGQQVDPTAICVVERQLRDYTMPDPDHYHSDDRPVGGEIHYVVRRIVRLPLKTPYPVVAERVAEVYRKLHRPYHYLEHEPERLRELYAQRGPDQRQSVRECYVDATGVGKPVVDLIRDKGVSCTAVLLTGGTQVTSEWQRLSLPKGEMVSHLQVLMQSHRVHMDTNDPEAMAAVDELMNYEIRVTEMKHVQTGVFKVGAHDDLATALALACWEKPESTFGIEYGNPVLNDLFDR